jgi:hypothetical protein
MRYGKRPKTEKQPSKLEKELLRWARAATSEGAQRLHAGLRFQEAIARRRRVAHRFQERIYRRLCESVGISPAEIERRQASDAAAHDRLIAKHARDLARLSKAAAKRQDLRFDWRLSQRTRIDEWREPALSVHLDRATWINVTIAGNPGAPATTTDTSTPGQNLVRAVLEVETGGGNLGFQIVIADCDFLWHSDRDGIVTAATEVWPNLGYILNLARACTGNPGVQTRVQAKLTLAQHDASGQVHGEETGIFAILDRTLEGADSSGKSEFDIVTSPLPMSLGPFAVVNGRPVLINVWVSLQVGAIDGLAFLDFERGNRRVNVPFVDLLVT